MNTYKLLIAYDGTNYGGWQNQKNSVSIQSLIEKALSTLLRKETKITGSGRTDAGVHALGQVAHFSAEKEVSIRSINALLPEEIRILEIHPVDAEFHARFSAKSKVYHYHFHTVYCPFKRFYSYLIPHKLDLPLLKESARAFVGVHDFTSFASVGGNTKDAIREITRLDVIFEGPNGIRLEFEGNGFLYKMVRNIVGTLLDVNQGKLHDIPTILKAKDRKKAGRAAPAHGLFLVKVNY